MHESLENDGKDVCAENIEETSVEGIANGGAPTCIEPEPEKAESPRPSKLVSMRRCVVACTVAAILFFCLGSYASSHGLQLFNDSPRAYAEGEQAPATEVAMRLYKVALALDASGIYDIDLDSATQDTITALLESTGDAHAEYYTDDAYKAYMQYTSGSYSGIGVVIAQCGKYTMVTNVYEGTPAAEAGVKIGDVVVSVDGEQGDWTPSGFKQTLHRDDGQTADVVWMRPTEESLTALGEAMEQDRASGDTASQQAASQVVLSGETFETQVEYGPVTIPNVQSELRDGVGYIKLSSFNMEAGDAVKAAVEELEQSGATSLVLDLRGNGGGYVSQAVKIVSLFVNDGVVMQTKGKNTTNMERTTGEKITDLPLVVLVDGNSASASEITASALKDNGRATVVGTVTYGKGTVQNMIPLSFGGAVKFTVAEYLGPNGEQINGVGVQPDVEVSAGSSISGYGDAGGSDPQLDKALEVASTLAE